MVRLAKRALEGAVALFALYAFATVPLGKRTGLEHLKAILSTDEAKEAGQELREAGSRILRELLEFEPGEIRGHAQIPQELLPDAKDLLATKRPLDAPASPGDAPSAEDAAQPDHSPKAVSDGLQKAARPQP